MSADLTVRQMTRTEVDTLVEWAAEEGWNPGLHDAERFWATDAEAFVAAEHDGDLIGGGAITSYEGRFGFMGFFIVRPEYRGRGLGNALWHARRERLLDRLQPGASIGMDGVFNMQDYYAKGGFVFSHRDLRFSADRPMETKGKQDAAVVPLSDVPMKQVQDYDQQCFPARRSGFLKGWIAQADARALGYWSDEGLRGFGVIRQCREGSKIGPLFADDAKIAETLYAELTRSGMTGPFFLDVPENNSAAMDLARRHAMTEIFGCARMYLGPPPDIAHEKIFGVTTFELG